MSTERWRTLSRSWQRSSLQGTLKKSLEALLTSIEGKGGEEPIDISTLDEEVQALIVGDMMSVITKTLKKEFKMKEIGVIKYTPREKDEAKDKLFGPLNLAVAEAISLAQQQTAKAYAADRAMIQTQIQKIDE